MVTVEGGLVTASISAFQIIKGLDEVTVHFDDKDLKVAVADVISSAAETNEGLASMKWIVMAVLAPALLLVLIGGLAVKNQRFGRGVGILVLRIGLVVLGLGSIMFSAAGKDGGIALTLLLVTGISGVVGGLLALVMPEPAAA